MANLMSFLTGCLGWDLGLNCISSVPESFSTYFSTVLCHCFILAIELSYYQNVGWLVGCFGLNGPLRQYFSLYRAVSQRAGERKEK